jgi:hypothetical protein
VRIAHLILCRIGVTTTIMIGPSLFRSPFPSRFTWWRSSWDGDVKSPGGVMTHFIYGIARDRSHALAAMEKLVASGVSHDAVSVLGAHNKESESVAIEGGAHAAHGSFSGGNIGGGIGWLVGLSTFAIPGIGLIAAAGPIVGFLAGIAIGRALGNNAGAMIEEMGINDASVPTYDQALAAGRFILSVRCQDPSQAGPIADTMRQAGLTEVAATPTGVA